MKRETMRRLEAIADMSAMGDYLTTAPHAERWEFLLKAERELAEVADLIMREAEAGDAESQEALPKIRQKLAVVRGIRDSAIAEAKKQQGN